MARSPGEVRRPLTCLPTVPAWSCGPSAFSLPLPTRLVPRSLSRFRQVVAPCLPTTGAGTRTPLLFCAHPHGLRSTKSPRRGSISACSRATQWYAPTEAEAQARASSPPDSRPRPWCDSRDPQRRPPPPSCTASDHCSWLRAACCPSCRRRPRPRSPLYQRFYLGHQRWRACGDQQPAASRPAVHCLSAPLLYPLAATARSICWE